MLHGEHRRRGAPGLVLFAGILGMAGFLTFVPLYALDLGMDGSRAVLGAWRTPAGMVAGTAVFATGVALLTPAVLTLAVQGVAPRERGAVIGTTSSFLDLPSAAVAAAGLLLAVRRPGRK